MHAGFMKLLLFNLFYLGHVNFILSVQCESTNRSLHCDTTKIYQQNNLRRNRYFVYNETILL